jgi:membrane protein
MQFSAAMWKWIFGANLAKKFDKFGTYASALAYCFVLSVVPFVVLSFAFASQFVGDLNIHAYQRTLEDVLPGESAEDIANILVKIHDSYHHNAATKTIGLVFALYTSFNLMNQIVRTLLFIFDDARRSYEWTWGVFIKTAALLAIWTFLLLVLTGCSILGVIIHDLSRDLAGAWRVTSDLVMIISLFVAFFFTYYLVPSKRYRFNEVRDGALVASLGWISCSLVFSNVLPGLLSLNMVYRALGSVVIILFWAQACAWSVIAGACWVVRFSSRR